MQIEGAVVLVTGASSGIGRAAALAFGQAGARVAVAARRRERLEAVAGELDDGLVVEVDLARAENAIEMVDRTLARFGRLDVLVNNAGSATLGASDALDLADNRRLLETNLLAPMVATQRAIPQMRRQGGGHVINVCSPSGFLGVPLMAGYSASKAAMSGWTRTLQAEWAGAGIVVTEVLPGLIATEFGAASTRAGGGNDAAADRAQRHQQDGGRGTGPLAALPAERVAEQILACVRRPRQVLYTSFSARLFCWLIQVPSLRRAIGARIGQETRRGRGAPMFTPPPSA